MNVDFDVLVKQYAPYVCIGLFAMILLRICRGKHATCSEYIFTAWNLIAFSMHVILDTYFLYTPRVTRPVPGEAVPQDDDYLGIYVSGVRQMWREYGDADNRVFLDEFQPIVQTLAYGAAIGGTTLTFLTVLGHLCGAKWAHPMQIVAGMWHIGLHYSFCMPEYLTGFQHVKDMHFFAFVDLPFLVMPALAVFSSLCKLSCDKCCYKSCEKCEKKEKKDK